MDRARHVAFAATAALIAIAAIASFTHPTRAATKVAADVPADQPPDLDGGDNPDDLARYGRIDERIRAAARRDRLPARVADELIRIFSDDVDLRRAAHPRDGFVVVVDDARQDAGAPAIVFASLTLHGGTKSYYRFAAPGGDADYFDPAGRSAQKRLTRRPLRDGWLNATFGIKRHPSSATRACTRASTGWRRWARRSMRPAPAPSRWRD